MKRKVIRSSLLLLFLLSPFLLWRLWLWQNVRGQLAAIHAAGLPANGRELDKWYAAVPDRENAALVLTRAFELRRNYPDARANLIRKFKLPQRGHPLTAEQTELLDGYIKLNAAMLEKADEALKLRACRYPADLSLCANAPLPHLAWLKGVAELKQYEALLALESGKSEEASDNLQKILALARTLDNEPILISQLVRLRLLGYATETLERRLNAGNLGSNEIARLDSAFARTGATHFLSRALIGERAFYASYFVMSRAELARALSPASDPEQEQDFPRRRALRLRLAGYYDLDLGYFLFSMGKAIERTTLPPPEAQRAGSYLMRAGDVAKDRNRMVSGTVLAALGGSFRRFVESEAYLRLARTALAMEQFRNQNGKLPESLDDLVPKFLVEVPEDPFTGLKLEFHRLDKGYRIYSVGPDLHDDEGLGKSRKKESHDGKSYDLTFTVER